MPDWCFTLSRSLLVMTVAMGPLVAGAEPLSDRVVAYRIDGRYDAKAHAVTATETLTYVNKTGQALDRFPFHLYLNAFQPKATWIREAHRDGSRDFGGKSGWEAKRPAPTTSALLRSRAWGISRTRSGSWPRTMAMRMTTRCLKSSCRSPWRPGLPSPSDRFQGYFSRGGGPHGLQA